MKKQLSQLAFSALAITLAFSCSQSSNNEKTAKKSAAPKDTVYKCYNAFYEGDNATMNLKIVDETKVEGSLVVNYIEKPANNGIVRGEFKGDTLYVDYSFKTGENPVEFSNPLAFLKKDSTLVMGVGQIETAYGRSYFVKGKPINYERGKFTFKPEACK